MSSVQIVDFRDKRIAELEAEVASYRAQLAAALARIVELEAIVAQLSRNSTNSSKPPSSDPPNIGNTRGKRSKRTRGAQRGHKGHHREIVAPEAVDKFVRHVPENCGDCGNTTDLVFADEPSIRHQVVEIPPIKPLITEHQCFSATCLGCGATTNAVLPAQVSPITFGPRLMAMVSVLTAKYRLSKRSVREMMSDFLGVRLSLGSVANVEKYISAALAAPYEQARAHIKSAPVVNVDETSWFENKMKAWLWVAATPMIAVFLVAVSRGGQIAKDLLGDNFVGYLVTDRWSAYSWVNPLHRQLCWSHLLRDFQSWVDGGGDGAYFGEQLIAHAKRMFQWWHKVRDGTLTREAFGKKMAPLQNTVAVLLLYAEQCSDARAAGMARSILSLEDALWTFVRIEGVEPTNNYGERTVRHAVLWRKGSFGTDSKEGSRFVERMFTTIATLRQQGRNVLEFITGVSAILCFESAIMRNGDRHEKRGKCQSE